ncbi:hypothetical protein [Brevundimonas subvibrioides]|uniref:hypothetical protein n=1 Tax=Brevundimonas subvibrioides TaxID=74313 RepID=UPI0022B34373|nr:hypothetical protein [Brevundimonas subvibrioides]
MRRRVVAGVLAVFLVSPPVFAQVPTSPAVEFANIACLSSGGNADQLARIAVENRWVPLSAAEVEALRSGTVLPRGAVGYQSAIGQVYLAAYDLTTLCSVHVRGDVEATRDSLELWSIGGEALGPADLVQPSITNRLVTAWRNDFWGVARGGVDAVNLNSDPDGSGLNIELSFPVAGTPSRPAQPSMPRQG